MGSVSKGQAAASSMLSADATDAETTGEMGMDELLYCRWCYETFETCILNVVKDDLKMVEDLEGFQQWLGREANKDHFKMLVLAFFTLRLENRSLPTRIMIEQRVQLLYQFKTWIESNGRLGVPGLGPAIVMDLKEARDLLGIHSWMIRAQGWSA